MKRFMAVIFSLFLVSGLCSCKQPTSGLQDERELEIPSAAVHTGWRKLEIPATATHTVQAFENDECEVVERNFPEKEVHDIIIVFKDDKFFVDFEYSDVIMLSIVSDDKFTRADAFTLIDMYGAQTGNLGE